MRRVGWLVFILLVGCTRPTPVPADTTALDRLLDLMHQRLLVMHDVARWKWNTKKPIADPEREEAFLRGMAEKGAARDLDPVFVRSFFRGQIEAAKLLQEQDFKTWQAAGRGPFADVPDLQTALRPRIDELSGALLNGLRKIHEHRDNPAFQLQLTQRATSILVGDGMEDAVRAAALQPLRTRHTVGD